MLKRASILLAAFLLCPMSQQAGAGMTTRDVDKSPCIADPVGRAGMVAVSLPHARRSDSPVLMMAGGANFPQARPGAKTPEERGPKEFYADVYVFSGKDLGKPAEKPSPVLVGHLPAPVGYAACAASAKGMVVAGGCNAEGHVSTVTRTTILGSFEDALWEDRAETCALTEFLPSLPVTLAYPAYTVVDDVLYVMGGQERADSTVCLEKCFAINLSAPKDGWRETAPMPSPRMLAVAGAVEGKIYVVGGCSLHPDANGVAERTYLDSILCYDPAENTWTELETRAPGTIVGAAGPMPSRDGSLYLLCGDPGDFYRASLRGEAPETHPGQSKAVYSYTPATGKWVKVGEAPIGIATAPAAEVENRIFIISGETHPGVRTPVISIIKIETEK